MKVIKHQIYYLAVFYNSWKLNSSKNIYVKSRETYIAFTFFKKIKKAQSRETFAQRWYVLSYTSQSRIKLEKAESSFQKAQICTAICVLQTEYCKLKTTPATHLDPNFYIE